MTATTYVGRQFAQPGDHTFIDGDAYIVKARDVRPLNREERRRKHLPRGPGFQEITLHVVPAETGTPIVKARHYDRPAPA